MNENPVGTPTPTNPMQPNPMPATPVQPNPMQTNPMMATPTPVATPTAAQPIASQPTASGPFPPIVGPAPAPTQPNIMQQPVVAPVAAAEPKKKHTGLIIGIIVALLLIGGGVAAYFFLLPHKTPNEIVSNAFVKLLSEDSSATNLSGTIDITLDGGYGIDAVTITLDASNDATNTNSTISAKVAANITSLQQKVELGADAILTTENLYLKVNDVAKTLEQSSITTMLDTEAASMIDALVSELDGKWIQVPFSIFSALGTTSTLEENSEITTCLNGLLDGSAELSQIFKNNNFIVAETGNGEVAQKQNPIYGISLNAEKLLGFANDILNSDIATTCGLNASTLTMPSLEDITSATAQIPKLYAEVDGKENLTRAYISYTMQGVGTATVDFTIGYNAPATITEPTDFIDLTSLITELAGSGLLSSGSTYDYGSTDYDYDYEIYTDDDGDIYSDYMDDEYYSALERCTAMEDMDAALECLEAIED